MKGWNTAEVANYAKLVTMGEPDFIEVKGVTYCGSSGASSLTMQNVPYHEDVCTFGEVCGISSCPSSNVSALAVKRHQVSCRRLRLRHTGYPYTAETFQAASCTTADDPKLVWALWT